MRRRRLLVAAAATTFAAALSTRRPALAQPKTFATPAPAAPNQPFLTIAEQLKPVLTETAQPPLALVRAVPDASKVLRFRVEKESDGANLSERTLHKGDTLIVDFGGHRTGYLSFRLETVGRPADSPARIRFIFGEVPPDVAEPLYPYRGQLSESWLPDELHNFDDLPRSIRLPRRHAFRYVKIDIIDTSPGFGVQFHDLQAHGVSAAAAPPLPPPKGLSASLRRIDEIACATLRDCLQTTFEDGPRRDQRLWVGDMRLQALTNYATFRRDDVVRRCLYLFAALPRQDGLVNACVFEKPEPHFGGIVILDYAALYAVALADYVAATGDLRTGHDLWPTARRQMEILGSTIGNDGVFTDPGDAWIFIDWAMTLDRSAAMHGVLLYAHRRLLELAGRLGKSGDVPHYPALIDKMTHAARRTFYDPAQQVYVSGPNKQVSWASQAWLTLAGVPETPETATTALRKALSEPTATKPVTPYLYHYVADAMLTCGMRAEAVALVETYWGGMVTAGADTFWEIYDPANPLTSPYGDIHINSYCHAWSCTPSYLIRARGLGLG